MAMRMMPKAKQFEDDFPEEFSDQGDLGDNGESTGETGKGISIRVTSVRYAHPGSSWRVLTALYKGQSIVCSGNFGEVARDMEFDLQGKWVDHPKYGHQFEMASFAPRETPQSIKDFLLSDYMGGPSGIGRDLWRAFKEDFPNVMENNPAALLKVIPKAEADNVQILWKKHSAKSYAYTALVNAGIRPSAIESVFDKWKAQEVSEILHNDPFRLFYEVEGIGYVAAHKLAMAMKINPNSVEAIAAAVWETFQQSAYDGHCFLTDAQLKDGLPKVMKRRIMGPSVDKGVALLVRYGYLEVSPPNIWNAVLRRAEQSVAAGLLELRDGAMTNLPDEFLDKIPPVRIARGRREGELMDPDEIQDAAVLSACRSGVSIITGGPGTGKTATMQKLLAAFGTREMYNQDCNSVLLCAPTGKAAKQLKELSGREAVTIHRLLECNPSKAVYYQKNTDHPITAKAIIVDEASMIDTRLMAALVKAIPYGCKLILVGDADQLPSVGAGNILRDLIRSNQFPVTKLNHIHRQNEGSYISENAKAILENRPRDIRFSHPDDKGKPAKTKTIIHDKTVQDFHFEAVETPEECQAAVVNRVKQITKDGLEKYDVQVLTPQRTGPVGTDALNKILQDVFNKHGAKIGTSYGKEIRAGDKVMQTVNDYKKLVFNGETGEVTGMVEDSRTFSSQNQDPDSAPVSDGPCFAVNFGDRTVIYPVSDAQDLTLAYAITIHKSQGSECVETVQVVHSTHTHMLNRSLVYTGVTRAREHCHIIGDEAAIQLACAKHPVSKRNTMLANRVQQNLEPEFPRYDISDAVAIKRDDDEAEERRKSKDDLSSFGIFSSFKF